MGLNVKPQFKLIANDKNVTATILDRFRSLRLTDESGVTSDTLEVTLADHDPKKPIAIPPVGAELELSLGYDGAVREMGLFVCDEIELSGPPNEMIIRARAAPYEKSSKGKSDLQTQKSRSWKNGTTIGAMVRKIAEEHKMKAVVSASLASIRLPHTDQSNESDMNLLLRLAKRYDAIAKPAGGNLVFTARGESKSATGKPLPRITVAMDQCIRFRVTMAKRESAGTVVAYYRDVKKAKRKSVKVGDGDPVKQIRTGYRDKDSALAAAKAEQTKRARGEVKMSLVFPGNPEVIAESVMILEDFRDGVNGEWLVTHAEHYLGPQGYTTTVECERPNSNKDVSDAAKNTKDEDQGSTEEGG
ncbi:MAG TPA: contractile injection system protein, VgrG/Pvc8 family [Pyrinomonadaceae bacterium]|nr:contractile injection system protein, VgrG/Pvc8 family [Pyrinomonadaceae bacterium]